MSCNQNCRQGRDCACHQSDSPFDEIANLGIELAGALFAICMVAMVAGMFVGWIWG